MICIFDFKMNNFLSVPMNLELYTALVDQISNAKNENK